MAAFVPAGIAILGHAAFSVDLVRVLGFGFGFGWILLGTLRFTPLATFPARSISGSRARNKAIAATTPVAATGRLRTASTAPSARSAPLSFASCQAFDASVPGLSRF